MLVGIILGLLGAVVLGAVVYLVLLLRQINDNMGKVISVLRGTAQMHELQAAQIVHMRKLVTGVEGMTAALRAFTGVVLQAPPEELPPQPSAPTPRPRGTPPPPPVASWDEFAGQGESEVFERDDEEIEAAERREAAKEAGVDIGEDIPLPDKSQVNWVES